jgi:hypothetical protein
MKLGMHRLGSNAVLALCGNGTNFVRSVGAMHSRNWECASVPFLLTVVANAHYLS